MSVLGLLLLVPFLAAEKMQRAQTDPGRSGYPDDVVVLFPLERTWAQSPRDAAGRPALTWRMFDGPSGARPCPGRGFARDAAAYPACERFQAAAAAALAQWAEAAGVTLTPAAAGERASINAGWLSFSEARPAGPQVGGFFMPNVFDFAEQQASRMRRSQGKIGSFGRPAVGGFDLPDDPEGSLEYGTVLFNDDACWFLESAAECAAPVAGPFPYSRPLSFPRVALHEFGHAFGFGHFREAVGPSVMREGRQSSAGEGPPHARLQPVDVRAARELYDRVAAVRR